MTKLDGASGGSGVDSNFGYLTPNVSCYFGSPVYMYDAAAFGGEAPNSPNGFIGINPSNKDELWMQYGYNSPTLTIKKVKLKTLTNLKLSENFGLRYKSSNDVVVNIPANVYTVFQFISGYLWKLNYNTSTKEVTLYKMDSSFNVLETHVIANTVTLYNVPTNFGIIKNSLYVRTNNNINDLAEFNLTTNTFTRLITLSTLKNFQYTANTSIVRNYDDNCLFRVGSYSNGSPFMFYIFNFGTLDTMGQLNNPYVYSADCFKHPDYPIMMEMQNSGTYLCGYFTHFLVTVNNLVTPVVKTSAQTMKVAYELTW